MRIEAPVWRHEPNLADPTFIGTLSHLPENQQWQFDFDSTYLRSETALELDPHWCRTLSKSAFKYIGTSPPGAFADVALSGWTFDIARRALSGQRQWTWWDRLVLAPENGFGALSVGDLAAKPDLKSEFILEAVRLTPSILRALNNDSSSGAFGGERPKLPITADGREWILKFPALGDNGDLAIAEATALSLGRQCGLKVPNHYVIQLSASTSPALMIERFDRSGSSPIQAVSAATALGLGTNTDIDSPKRSYRQLRSLIREPGDDLELYKRMVLNAIVHNGDDHPWNHSLVQLGRGRWALSPLYDVTPFLQAKHPCVHRMDLISPPFSKPVRGQDRINPLRRISDVPTLLLAGHQIAGLDAEASLILIEKMATHVAHHWRDVFNKHANSRLQNEALRASPERWATSFEGYMQLLK